LKSSCHFSAATLAFTLLATGCASTIHNAADTATQAAVDTLDSKKYKGELDDMAAEAAGAARDKMLDADTSAKLVAIRDAMLDERMRVELASMREELLGSRTRQLTLSLVDTSLSSLDAHADDLRERLTGKPLRDNWDALADEVAKTAPAIGAAAGSAVQAQIAPLKVTVDTEASKVKTDVEWAAVLFGLAVLVYVFESHRRAVDKLYYALKGTK
jgi:hypothetical protein